MTVRYNPSMSIWPPVEHRPDDGNWFRKLCRWLAAFFRCHREDAPLLLLAIGTVAAVGVSVWYGVRI